CSGSPGDHGIPTLARTDTDSNLPTEGSAPAPSRRTDAVRLRYSVPVSGRQDEESPMTQARAPLSWNVLTVKRPGLTRDLPPGTEDLQWVANSSTLISGERDAVLVDTFLTIEQSRIQADWVAASGKNLVAIYVTHGHGDHFFGLGPLLERFPRAKAVATPEVVEVMRAQLAPALLDGLYR